MIPTLTPSLHTWNREENFCKTWTKTKMKSTITYEDVESDKIKIERTN